MDGPWVLGEISGRSDIGGLPLGGERTQLTHSRSIWVDRNRQHKNVEWVSLEYML